MSSADLYSVVSNLNSPHGLGYNCLPIYTFSRCSTLQDQQWCPSLVTVGEAAEEKDGMGDIVWA